VYVRAGVYDVVTVARFRVFFSYGPHVGYDDALLVPFTKIWNALLPAMQVKDARVLLQSNKGDMNVPEKRNILDR
jgi:hypothetical protein